MPRKRATKKKGAANGAANGSPTEGTHADAPHGAAATPQSPEAAAVDSSVTHERATRLKELGRRAFKKAEYQLATDFFLRAAKACEDLGDAKPEAPFYQACLLNVGTCSYKLGDTDGAIHYFGRAIDVDSRYEKALFRRAKTLHEVGRNREAIEHVGQRECWMLCRWLTCRQKMTFLAH